jgi:hypothetical protein
MAKEKHNTRRKMNEDVKISVELLPLKDRQRRARFDNADDPRAESRDRQQAGHNGEVDFKSRDLRVITRE